MESVRKTYKAVCLGILYLCMATLHGCINDDYAPQDDPASPAEHPTYLVLHIQPLNPLATRAEDIGIKEAVRSLRVVMTDESGNVELNELINANGQTIGADGQPATTDEQGLTNAFSSDDGYIIYMRRVKPGKKHFYLFANEESVGEVSFSSGNGASIETRPNLKAFLTDQSSSTDFKTKIESAYFSPVYKTENSTIYLPYSTYYELELQQGVENEKTMYLVPVATKFEFHFKNTMTDAVTIDKITINSIAKNNYLLGNVNESDYNKDFVPYPYLDSSLPEEKGLYWVEWLRRVSEETQLLPNFLPSPPDNADLNDRHGWIKDYNLPSVQYANGNNTYEHKSEEISSINFPVSANGANFSTLKQWYYCPESKMMAPENDQNNAKDEQKYTVDFEITKGSQKQTFTGNVLPNLHALFRNTHVIVEVTISSRAEEVELTLRIGICPWVQETINIPTFD